VRERRATGCRERVIALCFVIRDGGGISPAVGFARGEFSFPRVSGGMERNAATCLTIAGTVAVLLSGAAEVGAPPARGAAIAATTSAAQTDASAVPHTSTAQTGVNTMPRPAAGQRRPNIIVILADDLGYADISTYRGGRFPTPHIDALARRGVLFTNGYASAPVCAPSRAGLLTGRYQERFGFEYNNGPARRDLRQGLGLSPAEVTLGQLLQQDGYHTGMVGKWHLGSQDAFYPTQRGFDEFVGFLTGATTYIDPKVPGVEVAPGPLGEDAPDSSPVATTELSRHSLTEVIEGPQRKVVHNENEYLTDYFAAQATEFIQRNSHADKPYFLYAAFNAVHSPHMVTKTYYDRFPNINDHRLRVYAAMVASLDDAVGEIMTAVAASGQANNTMIFFASDNGCAGYYQGLCSCEPLRGGKLSYYEGGTRVPFMLSLPGHIKAGGVYTEPVSLLDVVPTSVAAAGGKLPADRVYDGVDLLPSLAGNAGSPHDVLFWRRQPLLAIRKDHWKLWESADVTYGNYQLLFDLKTDPGETTNLAASHPEKVHELDALLRQWSTGMSEPKWPSRPPASFDVCGKTFKLPI